MKNKQFARANGLLAPLFTDVLSRIVSLPNHVATRINPDGLVFSAWCQPCTKSNSAEFYCNVEHCNCSSPLSLRYGCIIFHANDFTVRVVRAPAQHHGEVSKVVIKITHRCAFTLPQKIGRVVFMLIFCFMDFAKRERMQHAYEDQWFNNQ